MSLIRKGEIKIPKKRNAKVVNVFSKEEEDYIIPKKRNNPPFLSTPAGTVAKQKRSRSTNGQNELHRHDVYDTAFDKEEGNPVLWQQEITSPKHSNRVVMKNSVLFPTSVFCNPDQVSSTDATSMNTPNVVGEEEFEKTTATSRVRRSYSENKKTPDSVSIIGNHSRGAVWKKVKASVLRKLNVLDENMLEKIAFKSGIEMIKLDRTDINSALMERARECITKDMERYFIESIDAGVDPKTRKFAIEKLQNIMKEIKSSNDKKSDAVNSDQTLGCSPEQQTCQSLAVPDVKQTQMHNVASFSALHMVSVESSGLFSKPSPLATTVIKAYTSSETPRSIADTLQLSNKAENDKGGKARINGQQKMVCELCAIVEDNTFTETEEQSTNSTSVSHGCTLCSVAECLKSALKGGKCFSHGGGTRCSVAECLKFAQTGGKCISHGGGTRCSIAECSKAALKGGKCFSHGGGHRCSVAECSKPAKTGGKCTSHGGGTRCSIAECSKSALKGGKCVSHGGGTLCSVAECSKSAKNGGKCASHGGGIRCSIADCSKVVISHGGGTRCSEAECSKSAQKEGNAILMVVVHVALKQGVQRLQGKEENAILMSFPLL
eukprot:CAMPEP_0194298786 /NCGR_PEP_ID=MMETSP0169-20130528/60359_1 /TAXON_ID=218684 /ORGANISM="Corethron pennatum, Strain L29A3" /LENGTH=605 /DNA_ID=CAMNT_0039048811 /DNA_START=728 /DNA_END=2546 /DNA_ORIENTATION=-